jgi:hypothetical protein
MISMQAKKKSGLGWMRKNDVHELDTNYQRLFPTHHNSAVGSLYTQLGDET